MSFQTTHYKQHNLFSILYSFVLTHAVHMLHSAIEEKAIVFSVLIFITDLCQLQIPMVNIL